MIARTNAKGEIKIDVLPRKKELRVIFNKLLEDEFLRARFTKTTLQVPRFGLTHAEATQFIQFVDSLDRLFRYSKIGKGWEEDAFHVNAAAPVPQPMYRIPYTWDGRYNKSQCDRCFSLIHGKGRHNKTRRGHTKEECDLAMVDMLHQI